MISTDRFYLRKLKEADVGEKYLSWFSDEVTLKYIVTSSYIKKIDDLKKYVCERESRGDVLFLGIFTKDGIHIGNIKFEPIHYEHGYAILGILIGDKYWRGKGVGKEVILECLKYLKSQKIKKVFLGVEHENKAAIHLYESVGFEKDEENFIKLSSDYGMTMVKILV